MNRFRGISAVMAVAMAGLFTAAHAQKPAGLPDNYPARAVRFVIASSPGGVLDIAGRVVAQKLSERWGTGVIAENRAGNLVAFEAVMRANPDGYTLMVASISSFIGAELVLKPPYSVRTKFPPVAQFLSTPYVVSVNNDLPVKNIKEFIAHAKANPNKLNFAFSTRGSASHLFGELLKSVTGINMQGIPFKGVGPSYAEQMAGRINLTLGTAASAGPLVKSGRIRAIAVTSAKRTSAMPDLPTVQESLPGFDLFETWVGLLGVENMNPALINAINREVNAILQLPDVEKRLTADGSEITHHTPQQFRTVIANSLDSTARIVKRANVKLE